jgi:2-haloacid dehalogenase
MPNRYQLITFDVYTALFDVEGSLTPMMREAFGPDIDSLALVRTWRRKQLEYALISNSLQGARIPFWQITQQALAYTLAQNNLTVSTALQQNLMGAWLHLQPWPEAIEVLQAVKANGDRLGLLSNGDTQMLNALRNQLPPVVDQVFASEQAGHYKPHPDVYALPLRTLHLAPNALLHVAGSATDVMGTKAAGLTCAWSNRQHERVLDPQLQADYEFADLRGLLEII